MNSYQKQTILIVDDAAINRAILAEMLGEEYRILEAENGREAVLFLQEHGTEISLVLLDINMPEMDGFDVLRLMNQRQWIKDIPVIMISSEDRANYIREAYRLGITDFISRPFDSLIVQSRVVNTLLLYAKQKRLSVMVMEQIQEKVQQNNLMVDILSNIVEFRNGESKHHVLHIRTLTELFLRHLNQKNDAFHFTSSDITRISTAAAIHDVGKIAIPENILNKPGRLTDEEFAVIKTHSMVGADMLKSLPFHQDDPLVHTAYEICRWHHERYDGRGYPDGLKGDEIPICAQIVALADVYDALTSERVYKKAFSHETAVQMILDGQCGTFNPLLMEALREMAADIPQLLEKKTLGQESQTESQAVVEEVLHREELSFSGRTLQNLEHEKAKNRFFASVFQEIRFEYTVSPPLLTLSPYGAKALGLPETVTDPLHSEVLRTTENSDILRILSDMLRSTTAEDPFVEYISTLRCNGQSKQMRLACQAVWSADDPPRYLGAIGAVLEIPAGETPSSVPQVSLFLDPLTGLLNRTYAVECVQNRLKSRPKSLYVLALASLDGLDDISVAHGSSFGEGAMVDLSEKLRHNVRSGDIIARFDKNKLMFFIEYKDSPESAIRRVFTCLNGAYKGVDIPVSISVSDPDVPRASFDTLLQQAEQALENAKKSGPAQLYFFRTKE